MWPCLRDVPADRPRQPERIARARELLAQLEELWKARFSQIDALFPDTRSQE